MLASPRAQLLTHSKFDPTTSINLQLTVYCLLGQERFHTQLKVQNLLRNYWKSFEVESNLIKYSVIANSLLSFSTYLEIQLACITGDIFLVFFWQALARVK